MTIPQAAEQLRLSQQFLRVWASSKQGCPFITVIERNERNTYIVNEERMKAWIRGEIK
jgi:hypothetical protein